MSLEPQPASTIPSGQCTSSCILGVLGVCVKWGRQEDCRQRDHLVKPGLNAGQAEEFATMLWGAELGHPTGSPPMSQSIHQNTF